MTIHLDMKEIISSPEMIYINPSVRDIRNLVIFMEEHPETVTGVLVHSGSVIKWLHSKVIAVPWWWLDR